MSPEAAYTALGMYGGDDGIVADIPEANLIKAAASVGQKMEALSLPRGSTGVKFLARVYSPDVWFGDSNSCCDIARQLSKFHATPPSSRDITPEMKLLAKCQSFALTDENTPVIGELCRKVLEVDDRGILIRVNSVILNKMSIKEEQLRLLKPWLSTVDRDAQYPNDDSGWMAAEFERSLPGFDRQRFDIWLNNCVALSDFLKAPMCLEPKATVVKESVVVDGQIHNPPPQDPVSAPCKSTLLREKRSQNAQAMRKKSSEQESKKTGNKKPAKKLEGPDLSVASQATPVQQKREKREVPKSPEKSEKPVSKTRLPRSKESSLGRQQQAPSSSGGSTKGASKAVAPVGATV